MDDSEPCHKLIAAARTIPVDDRVPYAFEKRVMARLAGVSMLDPWALWGQGLARAAVLCVVIAAVLTASSFFVPSRNQPVPLTQAVEQALLAGMDNGSGQIGDTP